MTTQERTNNEQHRRQRHRLAARPRHHHARHRHTHHKGEPPRMLRPVHRHRPVARRGDPQVLAPRRPDVRRLLGTRTTRPAGGTGVRVTEGVRKIIVEWHGKGVPPEETAQSLRIPVDEVKAIILQAHPAPAPEKPAGIGDNRRES
nr:MAG TPA: Protein of unknown function (DUF2802) [Caudoviricetes sp.]